MTPVELQRYSRQIILPEFGLKGQDRLRQARVLVIGAGGLGSPASLYLAAAGVGTLGMIESDQVEAHNLHRQILHGNADVGRPKIDSARDRLLATNPHLDFEAHSGRLSPENAIELFGAYDLVVDGSDNFATRYLSNDAAVLTGTPLVYGAIFQYEGQAALFAPALGGPCYRCLFPEPPPPGAVPNCAEAGVFGALAGTIGSIQALLAIRQLAGIGQPPLGELLRFDALRWRTTRFSIHKDPGCPVCGNRPAITTIEPAQYALESCPPIPQPDAEPSNSREIPLEISVAAAHERLSASGPPVLLDVREEFEVQIAAIEGHRHIPLRSLSEQLDTLAVNRPVLVLCHHGMRSLRATEFLRTRGFPLAQSIQGGIDRWSLEIDPTVPRY